jgi:hypothetical protein
MVFNKNIKMIKKKNLWISIKIKLENLRLNNFNKKRLIIGYSNNIKNL